MFKGIHRVYSRWLYILRGIALGGAAMAIFALAQAPSTTATHLFGWRPREVSTAQPITITAGMGKADIPGDTNLCLQAAVDYVANLGGGVVHILPGRYLMNDSLHLRSRVTVRGVGDQTVLFKAPMVTSRLSVDLGYGHYDVSLAEPDKFKVGMGIHIKDDNSAGFLGTCATLIYRNSDRFGINRSLNTDYSRTANAIVRSVYPVISGYFAEDARVENLAIEGNDEQNDYLDGCRGGGVFFLQSHRIVVRKVTVRNYNGDGISFQQCEDILIEDCRAEGNRGFGFHPGSGSMRPIMRRLVAQNNRGDGLFYCLHVTFGTLEDSEFLTNGGHGISVGERDTDQLIRRCVMKRNGGCGIYFRPGDEVMAGNRTTIEDCVIEGNGKKGGHPEIHLDAALSDVKIIGNRIMPEEGRTKDWVGILIGKNVRGVQIEKNQFPFGAELLKDLRK